MVPQETPELRYLNVLYYNIYYIISYFPTFFLDLQQFISEGLAEPDQSLFLEIANLHPSLHLVLSAPSGGMESHNPASSYKDLPDFICFESGTCWVCLLPLGEKNNEWLVPICPFYAFPLFICLSCSLGSTPLAKGTKLLLIQNLFYAFSNVVTFLRLGLGNQDSAQYSR